MSWTQLSPKEAHELVSAKSVSLIDVRTEIEFSQGHPASAYNIPWMLRRSTKLVPNPHFIDDVLKLCSHEDQIILSCKSGNRSAQAAAALHAAGFSSLYELEHGFEGEKDSFGRQTVDGWKTSGLPVSFDAAESRVYRRRREEIS